MVRLNLEAGFNGQTIILLYICHNVMTWVACQMYYLPQYWQEEVYSCWWYIVLWWSEETWMWHLPMFLYCRSGNVVDICPLDSYSLRVISSLPMTLFIPFPCGPRLQEGAEVSFTIFITLVVSSALQHTGHCLAVAPQMPYTTPCFILCHVWFEEMISSISVTHVWWKNMSSLRWIVTFTDVFLHWLTCSLPILSRSHMYTFDIWYLEAVLRHLKRLWVVCTVSSCLSL